MKILIVDDDRAIVEAIAIGLQLQWPGVQICSAPSGEQGLAAFMAEAPDVTLLDVNLPTMSGWEALKKIREISSAPVLILTARDDELEKVKGLDLGADDYLTKPFGHLELFARIKAVLRRTAAPTGGAPAFVSGDLAVNFDSHEVLMGGRPVKLSPIEYNLLSLLVRNAGRVLPVETLLTRLWGDEYRDEITYLKTYISRLRHKLGDTAGQPHYIITERGAGYRFVRPGAARPERVSA
jgi:two-component system, OmpR family, KDP operon response regulator KdpE